MLCLSLLATLVAWGETSGVASSSVFELDLCAIESGMSRTEACAVHFSSPFVLDLREVSGATGEAVVSASSGVFVLDLREVASSGDDSVVAAFSPNFALDLRSLKDDDPVPSGGESVVEEKSFAFVLDLREVEESDAAAYGESVGFVLDLRNIKDESTGGTSETVPVVWVASSGFELDLRDLDPDTMGADVVYLATKGFELDLRKVKVQSVIILPEDITGDKAIQISEDWVNKDLDQRFGEGTGQRFCEMYGYDLKPALVKPTGKYDAHGNALLVWHDYVAGTDPTDVTSVFKASVEMVDGKPVITWSPALNGEGIQRGIRTYRILATEELGGEWTEVDPEDVNRYNFFTVTVEMPK